MVQNAAFALGCRCVFGSAIYQRVVYQFGLARLGHGWLPFFGATSWTQRGVDFNRLGWHFADCSFFGRVFACVCRRGIGDVGLFYRATSGDFFGNFGRAWHNAVGAIVGIIGGVGDVAGSEFVAV